MDVRRACKLGVAIGLANYLLFVIGAYLIGGDAAHGHAINGHYFLGGAGGFIEVGRALFLYSKWQAYSLITTFPAGLVSACLLTPAMPAEEAAPYERR